MLSLCPSIVPRRCPSSCRRSRTPLDSLMELTFQHLAQRCAAGQLRPAWSALLVALDRALLATHRSKFTQFLLWFVAQQVRGTRIPLPNVYSNV